MPTAEELRNLEDFESECMEEAFSDDFMENILRDKKVMRYANSTENRFNFSYT